MTTMQQRATMEENVEDDLDRAVGCWVMGDYYSAIQHANNAIEGLRKLIQDDGNEANS